MVRMAKGPSLTLPGPSLNPGFGDPTCEPPMWPEVCTADEIQIEAAEIPIRARSCEWRVAWTGWQEAPAPIPKSERPVLIPVGSLPSDSVRAEEVAHLSGIGAGTEILHHWGRVVAPWVDLFGSDCRYRDPFLADLEV